MIFINRCQELKEINELLDSDKFELLIVYGRRRVGKTELLKEAIKKRKNAYYFLCSESNNISHFLEEHKLTHLKANWDVVFSSLKENIIIFDEFPYLVHEDPSVMSQFQKIVDTTLKNTKTKLILLGSSIGMMEDYTLAYKSPLYGRKTAQLKLQPFNFIYLKDFFPKKNLNELVTIFGFGDGIPYYLLPIQGNFWDWLNNELTKKTSWLRDEVRFILKIEFKEIKTYEYILEAIALGKTTFKEIKDFLYFTGSDITPYIRNLEQIGLIKKATSLIEKQISRNSRYYITDNFILFWYRFIKKNSSSFELGTLKSEHIKREYPQYAGHIFEKVVMDILISCLLRRRPVLFPFTKIGKQWGKIHGTEKGRNTYEIDICALNEVSKEILFSECKWQERVDAEKIIEELVKKAAHVTWYNEERKEFFAIFAKSFKKKIKECHSKKVCCYDLDDLEGLIQKRAR